MFPTIWKGTIVPIACVAAVLLSQIFGGLVVYHYYGEHEPPLYRKSLFICACFLLEFIFNIIACILTILWILALRRPSLMHWNLKAVCFTECCCIFGVSFLRLFIALNEVFEGNLASFKVTFIIKIVHDTCSVQYFINHACVALERVCATFFVRNYENSGRKRCWTLFMLIVSLATIPIHLVPRYVFKDYYYLFSAFALTEILIGITCILLFYVNIYAYKNSTFTDLTTRYQTVENIRNLRRILVFILIGIVHNSIIVVFAVLIFIIWLPDGNIIAITDLSSFWNLVTSFFTILYPIIFNVKLNDLKQIIWPWRRSAKVSPYLEQPVIRSVTGQNLVTINDQQSHFRELQKFWDSY